MDKLRGRGSTFSTSGAPWRPFRIDPRIARQKARLARLKAKGLTPPADKASARKLCDQAVEQQSNRKSL